jgi:hypothetical protein
MSTQRKKSSPRFVFFYGIVNYVDKKSFVWYHWQWKQVRGYFSKEMGQEENHKAPAIFPCKGEWKGI